MTETPGTPDAPVMQEVAAAVDDVTVRTCRDCDHWLLTTHLGPRCMQKDCADHARGYTIFATVNEATAVGAPCGVERRLHERKRK